MNKLRERAAFEAKAVLGEETDPEVLERATTIWLYGCMFGAAIPKVIHVAHSCPTEVDAEHADLCPECASEHEIYAIAQKQAQLLALRSSAMPANIRLATAVAKLEGILGVKPVDCEAATQVVEAVRDVVTTFNDDDLFYWTKLLYRIQDEACKDVITRRLLAVLEAIPSDRIDPGGRIDRRLNHLTHLFRISFKTEAEAGTFYACTACHHRWETWVYAAGTEVTCPECKTRLSVRGK